MINSIIFQTKSPKISFLALAPLFFLKKHSGQVVRMPLKTVKMLFGSGITKPTIQALMRLSWKGAVDQWLPVFRVVTPDRDSLPSAFFVEFDPAFLDGVSKVFPDDLCRMLYYGIRDLSLAALEFAEAELMGDFQDWSPRAMEKMFLNRILSTQSPTGSAVARRIIYCPLCRHTVVALFYGTAKELHQLPAYRKNNAKNVILGDILVPQPRPKWVCTGCGLKLWHRADLNPPVKN